jgi:hypothetical protein
VSEVGGVGEHDQPGVFGRRRDHQVRDRDSVLAIRASTFWRSMVVAMTEAVMGAESKMPRSSSTSS